MYDPVKARLLDKMQDKSGKRVQVIAGEMRLYYYHLFGQLS